MLNRYTLPLISALVVSASLASCQRKAEEATTPAEGIVFTLGSPSRTKAAVAAGSSSVKTPVKASSGEEFTLEVSSCPWMVEESSAPATKVVPLDGSYFSADLDSFGVMTYSAPSEYAAAADRTWSWTAEAEYNDGIWAPSPSRAWPFAGNYLTFFGWAPYDAVTPEDNSGVPVISNFKVETAAADQVDLLVSKVIRTDSPSLSGICVPITFGHALTAVRFIGVRLTITSVTISGINDQGSFNMDTGEWSSLSNQGQTYSLTSDVTALSSTLMLIPQTLPAEATLTAETSLGTITASLACQVWKPGKEVTYKIIDPVTSFTVSSTGDKVRFSPGNLQYQASTGNWRFAAHQWDCVGNSINGNVYEGGTKCSNTQISDSYSGWIDLFGWGTSGHSFASGYGSAYEPWSTSTTDTDYGPKGAYGLTGEYADGDWGSAVASTLGSGWRTLTKEEWDYLLNTRDNDNDESTLYPRYCKATVNGVAGLVIFPDDYANPSGVTAPASVNTGDAAYTSDSWSDAAWTAMEGAGCVFLPAAESRNGASVNSEGSYGYYWSSTPSGANYAYGLRFYGSDVGPAYHFNRYRGGSVRLVQDL